MTSLLGLTLLFFPFNFESRYERSQNQEIAAVHPQNISAGFEKNKWRGIFEYTNFKTESGNSAFNIKRTHRDFYLIGGYNFLQRSVLQKDIVFKLFAGAGVGTYSEKIDTTLLGSTSQDQGSEKLTGMLIAGGSLSYKYVRAEFEGRPIFGENYDPQPQWSYVIKLGIQIPLGEPERKSISSQTGNKKPQKVP